MALNNFISIYLEATASTLPSFFVPALPFTQTYLLAVYLSFNFHILCPVSIRFAKPSLLIMGPRNSNCFFLILTIF